MGEAVKTKEGRVRVGARQRSVSALLAVLCASMFPDRALAGAWTLPEGEGLAIATVSASRAESSFDGDRREAGTSRFDKTEAHVLVEYGLTDRFTLKGRTEVRTYAFEGRPEDRQSGLGFTDVGGRFRVVERGGFVGSLEGTARLASASSVPGIGQGHRYASEYEARALAGYSFELAEWQSFIGGESAYRIRDGFGPDEVRADATIGTRPRDDVLLLLQSFSTVALGRPETETIGFDQHKLQASGVYDLNDAFSLQAGGFTTVSGRDSLKEDGVFAAVWRRF